MSLLLGIARKNGRYYHADMQTISLKLPDDLLAELEKEAKARRVTKSLLIRESLQNALRQRSGPGMASCYDLSRDLAGCVKGLQRDLADNPKYMKGLHRPAGKFSRIRIEASHMGCRTMEKPAAASSDVRTCPYRGSLSSETRGPGHRCPF